MKKTDALDHFMMGYWNQNHDDLYSNIVEAGKDFHHLEGEDMAHNLYKDLKYIRQQNLFPEIIHSDHGNVPEFWRKKGYHMIVTLDQCDALMFVLQ